MTKKQKSKMHRYFIYVNTVLIISSLLVAIVIFFNLNSFMGSNGEQVVYTNDYYVLRGKPTNYQKDLFKELTKQVEIGNEIDLDVVELVVKNFIADYYTWSNKQGPFDIGGSNFIFGRENTNFYRTSRRYFYNNMSIYINQGLNTTDLIEVESIEMGDADYAAPYEYYGEELEAFYVEASWTYKLNEKIDTSVFPKSASFTIVLTSDKRYEIVRFY